MPLYGVERAVMDVDITVAMNQSNLNSLMDAAKEFKLSPVLPVPSGDRTYYVSDEWLRAFRQLTPEQKLRWVEELAAFLRMAKISRGRPQQVTQQSQAGVSV